MITLAFILVSIATIILALAFLIWNREEIFKAFHRTVYKYQYQNIDPSRIVEIRDGFAVSLDRLGMFISDKAKDAELKMFEREVKWRMIEIMWPHIKKWEVVDNSPEFDPNVYKKYFYIKIIRQNESK